MKILVIAPTPFFYDRGCHVRIFEQAKFLSEHGHEVKIVTYHIGSDVMGLSVIRTPNFFWYQKMEPGPSWHKIYLDFFLLFRSLQTARAFRPDIIHAHAHEGALIAFPVRSIFGGAVVLDSQGSLTDQLVSMGHVHPKSLSFRILFGLERFIYRLSNAIIVSNQNNQSVLALQFGLDPSKISLIPDGIRTEMLRVDNAAVQELRQRYGILEDKKVIVYLGTLSVLEGTDKLLNLVAGLRVLRNDFILLLMGYPHADAYRRMADSLGIAECVVVTGRVDYECIYNYLALGDVAVSLKADTSEGNGKLFNYAAAGLPVICYDHASNRSILGEDAFYLDKSASLPAQARLVSGVLDAEPKKIIEMTERQKKNIGSRYSWDLIGDSLVSVYLRFLAKK
ncbi:MAG: glycosyltransferase [Candidatus Vogelbacteria bacterium]|nr:glycosyltransferase [Candidatus Vogelbacteria bacterium]